MSIYNSSQHNHLDMPVFSSWYERKIFTALDGIKSRLVFSIRPSAPLTFALGGKINILTCFFFRWMEPSFV